MSAPSPRGACPGLSAPMPTGDGLLVRLAPSEAMPVDAFAELCAAARRHGNGIMEVTARGSLQVRGLTPRSAPLFEDEVSRLGIAASDGVPVLTNSLPDDPGAVIDAGPLAAELRRALAKVPLALAPKVSVLIDGGGPLHLDALSADIRLRAVGPRKAPRWLLALQARRAPFQPARFGSVVATDLSLSAPPALPLPACGERVGVRGRFHESEPQSVSTDAQTRETAPSPGSLRDPTSPRTRGEVFPAYLEEGGGSPAEEGRGGIAWLGAIAPERATDAVLSMLREIAALGPQARAGDLLHSRGIDALRQEFRIARVPAPERRPPAQMIGPHQLHDASLAVGIALPFGHAEADTLAELARRAALLGVRAFRPAPDRALMLIGVSPARALDLATVAAEFGFIVDADDPRRRIAACPGAPACASGFIAARQLAAALAPRLAGLPDGIAIHISGCAKGCAHPASASLTVVGDAQGCSIIRDGTARATPFHHVASAELIAHLAGEMARVPAAGEAVHG
jgi:precorrin-3B synthase